MNEGGLRTDPEQLDTEVKDTEPTQPADPARHDSSGPMGRLAKAGRVGAGLGALAAAGAVLASEPAMAGSALETARARRVEIGSAYALIGEATGMENVDKPEILAKSLPELFRGVQRTPQPVLEFIRQANDRDRAALLRRNIDESVNSVHASEESSEAEAEVIKTAKAAIEADAEYMFWREAGESIDKLTDKDRKDSNLNAEDREGELFGANVTGQKIVDMYLMTRSEPNPFNKVKPGTSFDEIKETVMATSDKTLIASFRQALRNALSRVLGASVVMNAHRRGEDLSKYIISPEAPSSSQ